MRAILRAILASDVATLEAQQIEAMAAQHHHTVCHLSHRRMCNGVAVDDAHTVLDYPRAMGYEETNR